MGRNRRRDRGRSGGRAKIALARGLNRFYWRVRLPANARLGQLYSSHAHELQRTFAAGKCPKNEAVDEAHSASRVIIKDDKLPRAHSGLHGIGVTMYEHRHCDRQSELPKA